MIALTSTVRMVMIQFSFSNPDAIPNSVRRLNRETQEDRLEHKRRSSGTLVVEPTERCSILEFLKELQATYELIEAFYQERFDQKDPSRRRTYHMVRFLFVLREFAELVADRKRWRETSLAELHEMCRTALWRFRAFSNPFYKNGEEIPGQRVVSINLEARQPLFRSDGQPVVVWQKDESGKRVGESPIPLKADYHFRTMDGVIQLVPV